MTTTNEWREGYKAGFDDGYERAKREFNKYPFDNRYSDLGITHYSDLNHPGMNTYSMKPTVKYTNPFASSTMYDNGHEGETGC